MRILITGGAGFLGRAFISEWLKLPDNRVEHVTVYNRALDRQAALKRMYPGINAVPGDVRDVSRLEAAMKGHDIVIHAAAFKYVDLGEVEVSECLDINIAGAESVIEAARNTSSVRRVVGISTDKACGPINVYGATKWLMEKLFAEADAAEFGPIFNTVRYGNVIGSTGSVIPLWREQARAGGPLTITNPSMTRFWLTVREAVELIVFALDLDPDYGGAVVIPKLPATNMLNVAHACCQLEGIQLGRLDLGYASDGGLPDGEIAIEVTGQRFGEKVHEDLLNKYEAPYSIDTQAGNIILMPIIGGPVDESMSYGKGMYTSHVPDIWLDAGGMLELITRAEAEELPW